jgi:hypothetical protein
LIVSKLDANYSAEEEAAANAIEAKDRARRMEEANRIIFNDHSAAAAATQAAALEQQFALQQQQQQAAAAALAAAQRAVPATAVPTVTLPTPAASGSDRASPPLQTVAVVDLATPGTAALASLYSDTTTRQADSAVSVSQEAPAATADSTTSIMPPPPPAVKVSYILHS